MNTDNRRNWDNLFLPSAVTIEAVSGLLPDFVEPPLPPIVIDKATLSFEKFKRYRTSHGTTAVSGAVRWRGRTIAVAVDTGEGGATEFTPCIGKSNHLVAFLAWCGGLPPVSSYNFFYQLALTGDDADCGDQSMYNTVGAMSAELLFSLWADSPTADHLLYYPSSHSFVGGVGDIYVRKKGEARVGRLCWTTNDAAVIINYDSPDDAAATPVIAAVSPEDVELVREVASV